MIKKLAYISLILWMMLIFSFSSQVREESHKLSTGITEIVVETIEKLVPNKQIDVKKIHHLIRKNAHFLAYLVLGILSITVLRCSGIGVWKSILCALCICVIYAIGDEMHQAFVPGRGPGIKDVFIDSAGSLVGVTIYLGFRRILQRRSIRRMTKGDCHQ